ncbi:uncharacterized protein LOC144946908 [Lampetra fluviatilis]
MAWPCVNRACCLARCWNQLDVDDISIPLTHATFAEESLLPPANEAAAAAANSGGGHPGPGHPHPHQHHHQQQGLGVSAGGGGGDAAAAAAAREAPEKPSSRGASRSVTRSDYKAWRRVPREPSCKPRREYLPPEDPFSNDTQYKADFRVWPLHRREKPQWGHHYHDQLQQQQQLLPHQQHHGQQQQQDSVYTRLLGEDGTGRDGGGMMGPAGDGEGEPLVKKHGAESTALLAMAREVCIMPVQGTTRPDARRQETSPRRKRVAPASSSSPESRRPRTPTATATAPRRDLSSRAGPPPARHSRSPGPPPAAAAAAVVEKGGGDGAGAPGGGRGRRGSSRRGRKSGSQENDAAGPAAGGTATTRAGSESPRPVRRPPRAAGPGFESGLGSGSGSGPGPGPGEAAAVAAPRRAIEIPCGRPVARGGAGAAKSVTFGERAAEEEAAARGARGAGTSERRQKRNDGEAPTRETDTGATTGVAGPGSGPGDLPGGAAVGGAANAAGAGSGQGSAAGGRGVSGVGGVAVGGPGQGPLTGGAASGGVGGMSGSGVGGMSGSGVGGMSGSGVGGMSGSGVGGMSGSRVGGMSGSGVGGMSGSVQCPVTTGTAVSGPGGLAGGGGGCLMGSMIGAGAGGILEGKAGGFVGVTAGPGVTGVCDEAAVVLTKLNGADFLGVGDEKGDINQAEPKKAGHLDAATEVGGSPHMMKMPPSEMIWASQIDESVNLDAANFRGTLPQRGHAASLLIGASDCKRQSVSHGERGRARDLEKRLRQ